MHAEGARCKLNLNTAKRRDVFLVPTKRYEIDSLFIWNWFHIHMKFISYSYEICSTGWGKINICWSGSILVHLVQTIIQLLSKFSRCVCWKSHSHGTFQLLDKLTKKCFINFLVYFTAFFVGNVLLAILCDSNNDTL